MAPGSAEHDERRRHLAGRDVPCETCGYNLRDLEAERCPECGDRIHVPPSEARIAAEVSAYVRDRDLYCKYCHYNLRGMAGNRCPECGTTYMLAGGATRPRVHAVKRRQVVIGTTWLAVVSLVGVFAGAAEAIAGFKIVADDPSRALRAFCGAGLSFAVLPATILWARRKRRVERSGRFVPTLESVLAHVLAGAAIYVGFLVTETR